MPNYLSPELLISFSIIFLICIFEILINGYSQSSVKKILTKNHQSTDVYYFIFSIIPFLTTFMFGLFTFGVGPYILDVVRTHLGFNLIQNIDNLYVKVFIGLVSIDFISYFRHWILHKYSFFWNFHKVHHAPITINVLTTYREHPFSDYFKRFVSVCFFGIVGFDVESYWVAFFIRELFSLLHHANFRIPIGFFEKIIVTPQYHWYHHLNCPNNKFYNLGIIFTFWDRIMNTHHPINRADQMTSIKMGIADTTSGEMTYFQSLIYPLKNLKNYFFRF